MNFYSELFELKNDTGELLFYLISIGLACATCFENGLMCSHMLNKLPHCNLLQVHTYTRTRLLNIYPLSMQKDLLLKLVVCSVLGKPIERQALISTILASNPDLADREQR